MCISGGIFLTIISKDYFRFCLLSISPEATKYLTTKS